MTKISNIPYTLIFPLMLLGMLLVSLVAAFPANAQQQIQEQCTLGRQISIDIRVDGTSTNDVAAIQKNSVVSPAGISTAGGIVTKAGANVAFGAMSAAQKTAVGNKWGTVCLVNTVNTLSDWAFFILLTISFVFIVVAGFLWITSAADAEKQKKASGMILAALIGIVIAVIARIVPAVLIGVLV